jgi:hypothetical protein
MRFLNWVGCAIPVILWILMITLWMSSHGYVSDKWLLGNEPTGWKIVHYDGVRYITYHHVDGIRPPGFNKPYWRFYSEKRGPYEIHGYCAFMREGEL